MYVRGKSRVWIGEQEHVQKYISNKVLKAVRFREYLEMRVKEGFLV